MQLTIDIPNIQNIMALYRQAPDIVTPILVNTLKQSEILMGSVTGQNVPYMTGGLVKSFIPTPVTELSYTWGPNVKYALWVEQGTGIYGPSGARIVPVTAKALAWTSGGTQFIRKSIAGMQGRRYMERIVAAAAPQLAQLFQRAEQTIIETFAQGGATA